MEDGHIVTLDHSLGRKDNMSKDKLIVAQTAFKGAIELATSGKIGMEHIIPTAKKFADEIWKEYGIAPEASYTYPKSNVSKPSGSGGEATAKQLGFINKLVGEVTKQDADKANTKISDGLTGIGASELIKDLLQAKEDAKNTPASDSLEAPF